MILNRVAAPTTKPCSAPPLPPRHSVLGALPRLEALALPDRHLGLVPAGEHKGLENFLDKAADAVARHIDTAALQSLARPRKLRLRKPGPSPAARPAIAIAQDAAFAFAYQHLLDGWSPKAQNCCRSRPG